MIFRDIWKKAHLISHQIQYLKLTISAHQSTKYNWSEIEWKNLRNMNDVTNSSLPLSLCEKFNQCDLLVQTYIYVFTYLIKY